MTIENKIMLEDENINAEQYYAEGVWYCRFTGSKSIVYREAYRCSDGSLREIWGIEAGYRQQLTEEQLKGFWDDTVRMAENNPDYIYRYIQQDYE